MVLKKNTTHRPGMLRTHNMDVSPLFGKKKKKLCYQFPDPTSFLIFDLQIRGFHIICQPTEYPKVQCV